jgi:hypothetical protein
MKARHKVRLYTSLINFPYNILVVWLFSPEYLINAGDMTTFEYRYSALMDKVLFDIGQYTTIRNDLDRLLNTEMWLNDSVSIYLQLKVQFHNTI